VFLILSGAATGLSWLFYFRALQLGDVSRVAPIDKLSVVITICLSFMFLKEPINAKVIVGALLITAGSIVMLYK
jgi:transporter family protein